MIESDNTMDGSVVESDDEDYVLGKLTLKKTARVLDDDDEDNDISSNLASLPADGSSCHVDIVDSSQGSDVSETIVTTEKRVTVSAILSAGDRNDSDNDSGKDNNSEGAKGLPSAVVEEDVTVPGMNSTLFNSDIFDVDEESDTEIAKRAKYNEDKDENDENVPEENTENTQNEDEGFAEDSDDEPVISDKLKARLKQGASKKAKRESALRKSKTAVLELHSETQRIIRDSHLKLPYHQPESKSLDDFLSHARQKRKLLRQIGGASAYRNLSWYEENERLRNLQRVQDDEITQNSAESRSDAETARVDDKRTVTEHSDGVGTSVDEADLCVENTRVGGADLHDKPKEQSTHGCVSDKSLVDGCDVDMCDGDELPDLIIDTETTVNRVDMEKGIAGNDVIDNDIESLFTRQKQSNDLTESDIGFTTENVRLFLDETQSDEDDCEIPGNSDGPCGNIACGILSKTNWDNNNLQEGLNDTKTGINEVKPGNQTASVRTCIDEGQKDTSRKSISPKLSEVGRTSMNTMVDSAGVASVSSVESPVLQLKRSSFLTPKLAALTIPNITPRLSGDVNGFVTLDEPMDTPPQDPKLVKFVNRFLSHSTKRRNPSGNKDVTISIVEKERTGENEERLKLNTITYHNAETPPNIVANSGHKLNSLKEQLQAGMRVKREAARQKRIELYELDNEVGGFEGEEEEEEEEDEAEMTDGEESDEEWDEEERLHEEDEDEDMKDTNEMIDNEASEDDVEEDSNDVAKSDVKLRLDVTDDEDDIDESDDDVNDESKLVAINKRKRQAIFLSDDEEEESGHSVKVDDTKNLDATLNSSMCSLTRDCDTKSNATDAETSQCESSLSGVSDVTNRSFGDLTPVSRLFAPKQCSIKTTSADPPRLFNMSVESGDDTQHASRDLFDFTKPRSPTEAGGEDMDELLGLCSGTFSTQPMPSVDNKKTNRTLFDESSTTFPSTQGMTELLGLCSGTFAVDDSESQEPFSQSQKRNKRKLDDDDDDDDGEKDDTLDKEFDVLSPVKGSKTSRIWQMDSDMDYDENNMDEDDNNDGKSHVMLKEKTFFKGFVAKKGKIRDDFVENEAELSGSEFGSDEEEEDENEADDDVLQTELADSEVKLSEDQLRNQVGRVHQKQVLDEDERDMLRLQEMYLPDGDLYSDSAGRHRRFKWNNIDDSSQMDIFDKASDEEDNAAENQDESKWRMERYEREQWLAEQNKDCGREEDSQFVKFGQSFLKSETYRSGKENDRKLPANKGVMKGSLLARGKETLNKIAMMTKPVPTSSISNKSTKNCVFVTKSPDAHEKKDKPKKNEPSHKVTSHSSQGPRAKKPCFTPTLKKSKESVFNHF